MTDAIPWPRLAVPGGRAVGVRRRPRRHRRAAARPRPAAYLARRRPPSPCCAARTPARCSRGRRRRWTRCGPGAGDEVAAGRGPGLHRAAVAGAGCSAARPLQALARIHALAAAGAVPDEQLGPPAATRPPPTGCEASATCCCADRRRPALLVAAVVHAELAAAAPFASHNGIVARAAERLVLVARGVDEKSLVVPEAGHLALRAAYESNLRGYRDGGAGGRARLAALRRRGLRGRAPRPARCGLTLGRAPGGRGRASSGTARHASGTRFAGDPDAAADT